MPPSEVINTLFMLPMFPWRLFTFRLLSVAALYLLSVAALLTSPPHFGAERVRGCFGTVPGNYIRSGFIRTSGSYGSCLGASYVCKRRVRAARFAVTNFELVARQHALRSSHV